VISLWPANGDPWASATDIRAAQAYAEAAVHPNLPWSAGAAAANLQAAVSLLAHAHDYYTDAGLTDMASECAEVAANLQSLMGLPSADLYNVVWGEPVVRGTLAHLARRSESLIAPFPTWLAWTGLGLTVVGTASALYLLFRKD